MGYSYDYSFNCIGLDADPCLNMYAFFYPVSFWIIVLTIFICMIIINA